jgi:undecaprenyl-diphosphatase
MEALQAHDLGILYWFGSLHRPWLDAVAKALTHLGDHGVMTAVVLTATGVFLWLRKWRLACILVLVSLLALGVEYGAKLIVQRPRPDVAWRLIPLPNEWSFPSGHSLCSVAIYGCIGMLTAEVVTGRWRRRAIAAGFGMGILVGLTRPYLGVHYPLDVFGGWTAGLACALLGGALAAPYQSHGSRGPERPEKVGAPPVAHAPGSPNSG